MASRLAHKLPFWLNEFVDSPGKWYRRHALRLTTGGCLLVLLVITAGALAHLWVLSTDRAKEIRQELFQRDLRDLVSRFDADERYVIENNLPEILSDSRKLTPLLLPRQYYFSLPAAESTSAPRQPPRNCFVQLSQSYRSDNSSNRFCSYFSPNRNAGKFLYLAATLEDEDLATLQAGDTSLSADALRIQIDANGKTASWWIAFQNPPKTIRNDRYQITAFREIDPTHRNRDKKIEGWAYVQPQPKGMPLVHIVARLDFKEFVLDEEDTVWPPSGWRDTVIRVARRTADTSRSKIEDVLYDSSGFSGYSMSALGTQIFSAYGNIKLERLTSDRSQSWDVPVPGQLNEKLDNGYLRLKFSQGDLLLPATPTSQSESLPDTSLVVRVFHPWLLVEKGFWQISIYLLLLFAGGICTMWYFHRNLLDPIAEWSKYSERLARVRVDKTVTLAHAERNNEIGIFASAINLLIDSVRAQTARSLAERTARETEVQRKHAEEMQHRLQNLKVMRHEIRSPLQALIALHQDPEDPSRRYINRIHAALPHLLGGTATTEAIGAREFKFEDMDIANFLATFAASARDVAIADVNYSGPASGVFCRVDDGAIEDALFNILHNADRHRDLGSVITISLDAHALTAVITISNDGPIPTDEVMERIFEYGFSTAPRTENGGQGLGLFVSKSYLSRMNGTVVVQTHDRGVFFQVELPISPMLVV